MGLVSNESMCMSVTGCFRVHSPEEFSRKLTNIGIIDEDKHMSNSDMYFSRCKDTFVIYGENDELKRYDLDGNIIDIPLFIQDFLHESETVTFESVYAEEGKFIIYDVTFITQKKIFRMNNKNVIDLLRQKSKFLLK